MIKFENVARSYNGKRGCMCGCIGTYSVPTHNLASKASYENHSDRAVKIALNKINKAVDWDNLNSQECHSQDEGGIWFLDTEGRSTAIWLKEPMAARLR